MLHSLISFKNILEIIMYRRLKFRFTRYQLGNYSVLDKTIFGVF